MGLLGPSFQIGRSALAAYQSAIAVVGQNIANVGNPDYTRQTTRLSSVVGGPVLGGIAPGAGVRVSALRRHIDEAIENQLRTALGNREGANVTQASLSRVETLYNELTDQDLSSQLGEFFASFSRLQTSPEEMTTRNLVISAADILVRTIHRQRSGLLQLTRDMNQEVEFAAQRAGEITAEIARLNQKVVAAEARGQGASGPLRDRRDALLRELAQIMQIQVREQQNGSINVYVGGEPLVEFDRSRGPKVERVRDNGLERTEVRFADTNGTVVLRGGQLFGLTQARDVHLAEQIERLDRLANAVIFEVNRIHTTGRGLVGYTSMTGTYDVLDPNAALNSSGAGLPFPVVNGTLIVHVRDKATNTEITRQIDVDLDGIGADTTLADLAASLNAVGGISSSVTTDNRLRIDAANGFEIWFSEDSSGALAALGVGTFFQGQTAADIAVNESIRNDARLISTSLTGEPGDGQNAGRLARVADAASSLLSAFSVEEFHAATIGGLAVTVSIARTEAEASDAVYSGLLAQREAVSGVSLDEEAINLAKFERSFQGAARFLSVLDRLADEVLALV